MNSSLKIGLAQTDNSSKVEENLKKAESFIRRGSDAGVDLVVFPEMFMANLVSGTPLANVAEPLDGPFISRLRELARNYKSAIITGMWEKVEGESMRGANVVVAIDAAGKIVARYNKIHLFDALSVKESERMIGGLLPPPRFSIKGFNLGLAICYDLRFPELFRYHALHGADAVIVPAAWYAGPLKEDHWLTLLRARAIENTVYIAGSNLCGPSHAARSAAFDPFGVQLVDGGESEDLATAVFSKKRITAVRDKLPCLNHVKLDIFRG